MLAGQGDSGGWEDGWWFADEEADGCWQTAGGAESSGLSEA